MPRVWLTRDHHRYAVGIRAGTGGHVQLLLAETRPLAPGRYTLAIRRRRQGGRWVIARRSIWID